jgi:hypothetical protein
MAFVIADVMRLEGLPRAGAATCEDLMRIHGGLPNHEYWFAGERVVGNPDILPGTAIATFTNGRYAKQRKQGIHAAFFVRHDEGGGFWIMDQYRDKEEAIISARLVLSQRVAFGSWRRTRDNADAFAVILAIAPAPR